MKSPELVITGLTTLDEVELRDALPEGEVETMHSTVPEGTLAEPATITAIVQIGGSIALGLLSLWISKTRRRRVSKLRYRVRKPDGEMVDVAFDLDQSSEDAVNASVMAELGKWIATPPVNPG
jgi:hypothetical protein